MQEGVSGLIQRYSDLATPLSKRVQQQVCTLHGYTPSDGQEIWKT